MADSFADNDPAELYETPVIFISDEGGELVERWQSISGKDHLGINKKLKATAFAAPPYGAEELMEMAEKLQIFFTADTRFYDIDFSVSAPKRSELHRRVQCEINVTAAYTAAQEA